MTDQLLDILRRIPLRATMLAAVVIGCGSMWWAVFKGQFHDLRLQREVEYWRKRALDAEAEARK